MSTLFDKIVKTKKPHQCFMCKRVIESGHYMRTVTIAEDGNVYRNYSCGTCELISQTIDLADNDGLLWDECVLEAMSDDRFTGTPEEFLEYIRIPTVDK